MTIDFKLGYKQPDVLRYSAVPAFEEANEVLPEDECLDHDDFASIQPPIKYQKHSNCTNAAVAGLFEMLEHIATGKPCPSLSSTFLWSQLNGGDPDNGAFCRDVATRVITQGLPTEALVPESVTAAPRTWKPDVIASAALHRGFEVYQCLNWADVRSALARRFLVYYGFVLGDANAWFRASKDGKIPRFNGSRQAGHAQWARGLTRKFGDLRVINVGSWSKTWADNGIAYVDSSYFWATQGNFVNLDAYAFRAPLRTSPLPQAS